MPAGALIAFAVALAGGPVTFNTDIAPIVHARCANCHRPGDAAPFDLITYADVRSRAGLIARVTRTRQMPPWKPEPGFGTFAHSRRLTDRELALIDQWVRDGAPEGSDNGPSHVFAAPAEWQLGEPDLVLRMPEAYNSPQTARTCSAQSCFRRARRVAGMCGRSSSGPARGRCITRTSRST
jgi:hypothetical protein